MKKLLLLSVSLLLASHCGAQFFYATPLNGFSYYFPQKKKQMLITDSMLYTIKSGGLELLNLNTNAVTYRWENHYNMRRIVADTGGHYAFVKDYNIIERFNIASQQYEPIQADSLQNQYVDDIDVSPNGNLWITTDQHRLFIYDGSTWESYNFQPYWFSMEDIKVLNDTLAYARVAYNQFYRFHQGILDSIYTLSSGIYYYDWDVDPTGTFWIAGYDTLVRISNGMVTKFDAANTPLGTDKFQFVNTGTNGHAWTAGTSSKMLEFDGLQWSSISLPVSQVYNVAMNSQNDPWVTAGYMPNDVKLCRYDGNIFSSQPFFLMPFQGNITALSFDQIATPEGVFSFSLPNAYINLFEDSLDNPANNKVTCFTTAGLYNNNYFEHPRGTTSGVIGLSSFDNTLLPSQMINSIYYDGGSYYIGTDSGLVIFNGIFYDYFNTQNASLPSDKITFIISDQNLNELFVGTDKGFATYKSGIWTAYDSSDIVVSPFYVTGILPHDQGSWNDSAIYITTMGSGIIRFFDDGNYELFNNVNGNFPDDTVYYVSHAFLGKCGEFIFMGTKNNGVAIPNYYFNGGFVFDTSFGYTSKFAAKEYGGFGYGGILAAIDSGLYYQFPCSAVETSLPFTAALLWQQDGNHLIVNAPQQFSGKGTLSLTDALGKTISVHGGISPGEKIIIDEGNLPFSTYILHFSSPDLSASAKLLWTQ